MALTLVQQPGIDYSTLVNLTNGQIKFPVTQNPSSDHNTLDDYEEGTWTATDQSGAGLSLTQTVAGTYTKIGDMVFAQIGITYPSTANGLAAIIGGLPYASTTQGGAFLYYTTINTYITALVVGSGTNIQFFSNAGATIANSVLSTIQIRLVAIYFAS